MRPAIFHDDENPTASTWPVRSRQITIEEAKAGTEGNKISANLDLPWDTHTILNGDVLKLF